MIQTIIQHIDSIIDGMPYFSTNYGLCELKSKTQSGTSVVQPVYYSGSRYQIIQKNQLGFTYWRQTGPASFADSPTFISGKVEYEVSVPMRLFAMTKRSTFPEDNAYSAHRLAATLIKAITVKGGKVLKDEMKVRKLLVFSSGYITDSQQILGEEFNGISFSDFKQIDLAVAVGVNITFSQTADCIIDPCDE